MEWNKEISGSISQALRANDVEALERLLRTHPEYLLKEGHDKWVFPAAAEGKLDALKALVRVGLDINQTEHPTNSNLFEPEGAIVRAARRGHLEVVSWMLDNGAEINFRFKGHDRCLALHAAATGGHLDVVKLLVERGADIHATNGGMGINAITQAALFGQWDVYDYLYSLGARDIRDTTPPNLPEAHEKLIAQMVKRCGPLGVWQRSLDFEPSVKIHSIPANEKSDLHVLFTVGLSDRRLPRGRNPFYTTELRWMLPREWPISDAAFADPQRKWIFDGIDRIVSETLHAGRWPEKPVIFLNGDPPQPIAAGSKMCDWLCLDWVGEGVEPPDHRVIHIHSVFPIYAEEATFAREHGQDELVNRFNAMKLPLTMTLDRKNAVTDWSA